MSDPREHIHQAIRRAIGTGGLYRDEIDFAKKVMLTGVRFTMHILGVERDKLLARFVENEFQTWVGDVEQQQRKGPASVKTRNPKRRRA